MNLATQINRVKQCTRSAFVARIYGGVTRVTDDGVHSGVSIATTGVTRRYTSRASHIDRPAMPWYSVARRARSFWSRARAAEPEDSEEPEEAPGDSTVAELVQQLIDYQDGALEDLHAVASTSPMAWAAFNFLSGLGYGTVDHTSGLKGDTIGSTSIPVGGMGDLSKPEQLFVQASLDWTKGRPRAAAARLEAALLHDPSNVLVVKVLHELYYFMGDAATGHDALSRVIPRWDASHPHYTRVLGMYACSCVEVGDGARGEEFAMRTLHMDPTDMLSIHAMLHIMEAGSRRNEGTRLIRETQDDWEDCPGFSSHMNFHWVLFLLDDADMDDALARFRYHAPWNERNEEGTVRDLVDATSLLWRFELAGLAVEHAWELNALAWARVIRSPWWQTFGSTYYGAFATMALSAAREVGVQDSSLSEAMGTLETTTPPEIVESPPQYQVGESIPHGSGHTATGLRDALWSGLREYREGGFEEAIPKLLKVSGESAKVLGGTRVDRDVFLQTMVHAATEAGHMDLARSLLCQRIDQRPASPGVWFHYAGVLDELDEPSEALIARERAFMLGLGQGGHGAN